MAESTRPVGGDSFRDYSNVPYHEIVMGWMKPRADSSLLVGVTLCSHYDVIRPFMSDVPMRRPDPRKNV